jgi:ATP-dependent helicase/nuclease subunit B
MHGRTKRVYTIPPGAPFLRCLAENILNGQIVPGFTYDPANPQSLADVTIYVPTRRAARVLRSEFTTLLARQSAILPVIRPLGETDDDSGYFDAALPEQLDLLPPIGPVPAALELARLIEAWRNSLPKAVLDLHDGAPVIAPASAADAVWLAKELASLVSEVETAEADWSALDTLVADDYAAWWQLTLEFLRPSGRTACVFAVTAPQCNLDGRSNADGICSPQGSGDRCRFDRLASRHRQADRYRRRIGRRCGCASRT